MSRQIEDCPELNLSNYDGDDVARLNDWAVRADAEIERLRKIAAHVPAMVYLRAKEAAGFARSVRATNGVDSSRGGQQ